MAPKRHMKTRVLKSAVSLVLVLALCLLCGPIAAGAAGPTAKECRILMTVSDPSQGTFSICAQDVPQNVTDLVAEVHPERAPQLTASYPMRLDTEWRAEGSIRDFHALYGTYAVTVRSVDENGNETIWGTGSVHIGAVGTPAITVEPKDATEQLYLLTLSGVELPGKPLVWFDVQSQSGNGRDRRRYPAYCRDGRYTASVQVGLHGHSGVYEYAAHCGFSLQHSNDLGSGTFLVKNITSASVSFENIDRANGTFRVRASIDAPSGVAMARIAVWARDDQSDIRWVTMAPDEGTWISDFNIPVEYGRRFGLYHAHVYANLGNGASLLATAGDVRIEPQNHIWVEKPEARRYLVHVLSPTPDNDVRVAVWSEDGGQDDLVWYPASWDGQGSVTATVSARRHKSSGTFQAHVYSGSTLLGGTTFQVPQQDVPQYPYISNPPARRTEWFYTRNAGHQPPAGAWSADALRPYGAYYLGDTSRNVIYLAFDAGYDNGNTGRILDTLKANNVHAAFFVTWDFLNTHPDLALRMVQEGHVVGNHTVHHPDMTKLSDARLRSEITGCANKFKEVTGRDMDPFLRPPEGVFSGRTMLTTRDMGYQTIFWSMAYNDWNVNAQPSVDKAYRQIVNYSHPGCITLLHTVSSANARALGDALRTLREQGYEFGSLYDLP